MDATARFEAKVERIPFDTCWWWTGSVNDRGYGYFQSDPAHRRTKAHRFAYELANGSIPDGAVIDHTCRNHGCVNPAHLEAVTNRENILRGVGLSSENARKTTCPRGHPYDMVWSDGLRRCRTCVREQRRG